MNENHQIPENENLSQSPREENIPPVEEKKEENQEYRYSYTPNPVPPVTPPPQKPKKNKTFVIIGVLVVLYLALVLGLVALISSGALEFASPESAETQKGESENQTEGEKDKNAPIKENPSADGNHLIVGEDYSGKALTAADLYEQNVGYVVFVEANYPQGKSTGSGFVIDGKNGYILTNHHVVASCENIGVTFQDGESYTAKLIGSDSVNDVAVLKIEKEGLKNVTIGNSDNLKIGDDILVIGNPLGDLTFTLTRGVVSGVDRVINTGENNITTFQTDAAINSGNSGGPAFDATGAVVGIASAKYAATGVEGIGFCIPINDAMEIAKDLVAHGYVTGRPNFGISVTDSSGYEYTTDEWGRRVIIETMPGARVESVGKGTCAEKAGLKVGDIVTKLNDKKVKTANELINEKNRYKAGDTVTVEVYRDSKTITLTVTLDEYTPE